MLHSIAIPYKVIDDESKTNKEKLLKVVTSRLHYLQTHHDMNNYTLAQINQIIEDMLVRFSTYHGETMIFAQNMTELIKGIDLKKTFILIIRRAGMYTGGEKEKTNRFKNKIQNRINHINNERLYTYTEDTLQVTLAQKQDMIQYLTEVARELKQPGSF